MIKIPTRKDQHLAVFGLGVSGLAAAAALAASGADVLAWDDDAGSRERAASGGVPLHNLYGCDWAALDGLVLAPGIPLTHSPHKLVDLAARAHCPVLGDIELLVESCPDSRFIAITGTNGKSTTTALTGHVLAAAGLDVRIGGNLGPPALGFEPPLADSVFALELSSYQLDLTRQAAFDVAVLLNITPDHLDRHGDMAGYVAAKGRIFRDRLAPGGRQTAVIGVDDNHGRNLLEDMVANSNWRTVPISSERTLDHGVFARDGVLYEALEDGPPRPVADLTACASLPGTHNWQNAAAAFAAARALGLDTATIGDALAGYPGLPHRQELVTRIHGIDYVNDSKATNANAAFRALACYPNIYWIAGGLAKEGGLGAVLALSANIRHVFLVGSAEQEFAAVLSGQVPVTSSGTLANAVAGAHRLAQSEGRDSAVVLLSPACASFDQWSSFEARGDAFRELVLELAERGAP